MKMNIDIGRFKKMSKISVISSFIFVIMVSFSLAIIDAPASADSFFTFNDADDPQMSGDISLDLDMENLIISVNVNVDDEIIKDRDIFYIYIDVPPVGVFNEGRDALSPGVLSDGRIVYREHSKEGDQPSIICYEGEEEFPEGLEIEATIGDKRVYTFNIPLDILQAKWGDTIGFKFFARKTGSGGPGTDNLNYYPDLPVGISPVYPGTRVTVEGNYEHITIPIPPVHNIIQDEYYGTIQEAINGAKVGDTIEVASGEYEEILTIKKDNLTLKAEPGVYIKPDSFTVGGWPNAIIFIEANGVTIDGFELDGNGSPCYGILGHKVNNLNIRNNKIHDIGTDSVGDQKGCGISLMSWGDAGTVFNNHIEDNEVYNTGRMGIMIMDNDGGEYQYTVTSGNNVIGNTVYNTWEDGGGDHGGGIQINVGKNCLIEGNEVYDTNNEERGIYITGSAEGNKITNNIIRDNPTGIAIWVAADADWIDWGDITPVSPEIHDNKIYGNSTGIISHDDGVEYILNATKNWWGDESGPEHVDNAGGSGDKVSGNVVYFPWYINSNKTTLVPFVTLTKIGPANEKQGNDIIYTVTCKNESTYVDATEVVITETYPAEVEFVSSDRDPDVGTTDKWTIGTLEAGKEDTIKITVKIK